MKRERWTNRKLLELSGAYWQGFSLHAGVKLGIFDLIGNDRVTAEELSSKLNADARALGMFLNALTAMGLLTKEADEYANTPEAKSLLVKESHQYVGYMIMHHRHLVEAWSRLDMAVRTGRPPGKRASYSDEERESFLMGMFNMAMGIAPGLAEQIDLKGRRHLLDLGGGPGTYAIHFCLANPDLKATVSDLITTRPFAEKTIARFGLADRIGFVPCDYLKDDIKGTYDVAWLSHILHAEGPETCRMIVKKAVSALEPGGLMLVHDFILDNNLDSPRFAALFSLNMLVNTEGGQSYSQDQIMGMLQDAGLDNIRRLPFQGPNESGIIRGTS